ncbi:MAG: SH3 domain-containing protein, partial [Myxococcota bacterium]
AKGIFEREKEAIDDTLKEVLALPKSLKAAALVVMLGACGSASWDALKYTYSAGQGILEVEVVHESREQKSEIALYLVQESGLRLRKMPSTESHINGLLNKGEQIVVFEISGDWVYGTVLGRPSGSNNGWVHRDFITEVP